MHRAPCGAQVDLAGDVVDFHKILARVQRIAIRPAPAVRIFKPVGLPIRKILPRPFGFHLTTYHHKLDRNRSGFRGCHLASTITSADQTLSLQNLTR